MKSWEEFFEGGGGKPRVLEICLFLAFVAVGLPPLCGPLEELESS